MATDLNLQLTLARLHLRSGNHERAVPMLEGIVAQAPLAPEPYALLAESRLALGRVDGALEAMKSAAELNPRHYTPLAALYERQGRWQDAANAYEQAVAGARGTAGRDLRLRYVSALLNVADEKNATKARDVLKDLLLTAPQDARGLFLLSSANLRLGDLPGAEDVARKLLALDATSMPGLHALSAALIARRDYRQVIAVLTPLSKDVASRAKGRASDAALLLSQMAHAHTQLGEHEQALAVLTTAVASDPLNAPALNSLGYTLAERGQRLPEAVGFIERALKVEPDNPSYLDSLGWALFKQGRVDEAEGPLRRAADALPTQSVIQDHYGDVLAGRGKYQEAITVWERALKGDGEDIDKSAVERKIRDARGRKP
ncbi:MAG: tetratricopeptide repeat protein [Acidobacteria bacterium]|nr:tetratricopeptide repeat protein [Acidobacteriota bacterium]